MSKMVATMMGLGHITDYNPRTGASSNAFQGLDPKAGTWSSATVRDQLMYPLLNGSIDTYQAGDLLGLWQLYGTQACPSGRQAGDAAANDGDPHAMEPLMPRRGKNSI